MKPSGSLLFVWTDADATVMFLAERRFLMFG